MPALSKAPTGPNSTQIRISGATGVNLWPKLAGSTVFGGLFALS